MLAFTKLLFFFSLSNRRRPSAKSGGRSPVLRALMGIEPPAPVSSGPAGASWRLHRPPFPRFRRIPVTLCMYALEPRPSRARAIPDPERLAFTPAGPRAIPVSSLPGHSAGEAAKPIRSQNALRLQGLPADTRRLAQRAGRMIWFAGSSQSVGAPGRTPSAPDGCLAPLRLLKERAVPAPEQRPSAALGGQGSGQQHRRRPRWPLKAGAHGDNTGNNCVAVVLVGPLRHLPWGAKPSAGNFVFRRHVLSTLFRS